MYLFDRINNIDNRPVIAKLYGIDIPQYSYKVAEMEQEVAKWGGCHDVFFDCLTTLDEHIDRQQDTFKALLVQQGLPYEKRNRRLKKLMTVYKGSCGDDCTGDFRADFETYRATKLHSEGLKRLLTEHIISAVWSVICVSHDYQRMYYTNEGFEDNITRDYIMTTSTHILDVSACIHEELKAQGRTVTPAMPLRTVQELLNEVILGFKGDGGGGIVLKYLQVV